MHLGLGLGFQHTVPASGSGGGIPPFVPANNAIVAKGGFISTANTFQPGYVRSERRSPIIIGGQNVKSIRPVYWNGWETISGGEQNGTDTFSVECALEGLNSSGVLQTVIGTFNQGVTGLLSMAPGDKAVPDAFLPSSFGFTVFPPGAVFIVRTGAVGAATTVKFPYPELLEYQGGTGYTGVFSNSATSQIANTGPLITPTGGLSNNNTNTGAFGPTIILGEWANVADVSLMVAGDSIQAGKGDAADNGITGGGFVNNGTRNVNGRTIPMMGAAKPSGVASTWLTNNTFRVWCMQFCTHLIENFGTNEASTGSTSAAIIANKQALYALFRDNAKGAGHIACATILPRTGSTTAWADTDHQTPVTGFSSGGVADTVNATMASLVGMLNGPNEIFDARSLTQDATITTDWRVNVTPTTDGVHPTSTIVNNYLSPALSTQASAWAP